MKWVRLTDAFFAFTFAYIALGFVVLPDLTVRVDLIPGVYAPELYKIGAYSAFAVVFLRKRLGAWYGLGMLYIGAVAESIGNTTYFLWHIHQMYPAFAANFWEPFPAADPTLTFKWLLFYAGALIGTAAFGKRLLVDRYWLVSFAPLLAVILALMAFGYPTNTMLVAEPAWPWWVFFAAEVGWMATYLGCWAFNLSMGPPP